ncbi:TetR family transcriptional regulator [Streptomyces polyrhachis]|uniref:TetR family transcriptional regulator n=1 Tax=Streptomyces polyrhachis TaxID=1282885 RepID=A0ABW2GHF7_9ACTN
MTAQVRTVDGRIAGHRGQATRSRLLESLGELLASAPYRDVKVIDVARKAGTSPATFYQYFPDVETAVLELAGDAVAEGAALGRWAGGQSWTGKAGARSAAELVDSFLAFWRRNEAILRVVDLSAAEGDKRFTKLRAKILTPLVRALSAGVEEVRAKGAKGDKSPKGTADESASPTAVAGSLVTMLAATAAQLRGFQGWGVKQAELKPTLATLVQLGMTGRKGAK